MEEIFSKSIAEAVELGGDIPVWITETGCTPGPRRLDWLRKAMGYAQKNPRLQGVIYFDFNKSSEGEFDWRLDQLETEKKLFNQWMGIPVTKKVFRSVFAKEF